MKPWLGSQREAEPLFVGTTSSIPVEVASSHFVAFALSDLGLPLQLGGTATEKHKAQSRRVPSWRRG